MSRGRRRDCFGARRDAQLVSTQTNGCAHIFQAETTPHDRRVVTPRVIRSRTSRSRSVSCGKARRCCAATVATRARLASQAYESDVLTGRDHALQPWQ